MMMSSLLGLNEQAQHEPWWQVRTSLGEKVVFGIWRVASGNKFGQAVALRFGAWGARGSWCTSILSCRGSSLDSGRGCVRLWLVDGTLGAFHPSQLSWRWTAGEEPSRLSLCTEKMHRYPCVPLCVCERERGREGNDTLGFEWGTSLWICDIHIGKEKQWKGYHGFMIDPSKVLSRWT